MSWTEERTATLKRLWEGGSTATEIAKELGDSHIATEVLLLGIETVDDKPRQLMRDFGLTSERLREALKILRGGQSVSGEDAEANCQAGRSSIINIRTNSTLFLWPWMHKGLVRFVLCLIHLQMPDLIGLLAQVPYFF